MQKSISLNNPECREETARQTSLVTTKTSTVFLLTADS